jgi:hypothetical protein
VRVPKKKPRLTSSHVLSGGRGGFVSIRRRIVGGGGEVVMGKSQFLRGLSIT